MTFAFRPSHPADAPVIAELCERVLPVPEHSRVFSGEQMQWKYWDPWPTWQGSRSFLLFEQEKLIAHAGMVPLRLSRAGEKYTLVQLIDWAADPTHVGAGVMLLKRIAALADGAVSVRGSTMTQRILKPLGFRSFGQTLQFAARPRPSANPLRSELARASTVRIHSREHFAAREHPLSRGESTEERVVFQRSAAEMAAWVKCPVAPMDYAEVFAGDRMIGSFLVCHTPQQARIADAWADERLEGAWEAVIELAYHHGGKQDDATEVVCQSNDPLQQRALEACGFVGAGADPLAILTSPSIIPDGALVRHHLIDSDLAYLHHGDLWSWLP